MRRNILRRVSIGSAAIVGSLTAGFLTAHALAGAPSSESEEVIIASDDDDFAPIAPIQGEAAQIFSGSVTAITGSNVVTALQEDGVSITLRREPTGEVCWSASFEEATYGGCDEMSVIRTGLAFGQFYNHGRGVDIIGVVPDDVDYVLINGERVGLSNNVWHYFAGENPPPITLSIGNADGRVVTQ